MNVQRAYEWDICVLRREKRNAELIVESLIIKTATKCSMKIYYVFVLKWLHGIASSHIRELETVSSNAIEPRDLLLENTVLLSGNIRRWLM